MADLNLGNLKYLSLKLKDEGNKFLSENRFASAAQKYLEAIEILPDPIYYANRAQGLELFCINYLRIIKYYLKSPSTTILQL